MTHHESVRTREITAMGIRTRVFEAGEAGPEAVVFVHGAPGSANDWDYFLPRVGEFARAVAFDVVGFGRADKPRHLGYSGPVWATFVQHVLNELGIRRVHLVATDLGGEAATYWAAAHPDAFASAALLNTGTLIRYRWHAIALFTRLRVLGGLSVLLGGMFMRPALSLYEPRLPRDVLNRWRREYDWASRRAIRSFYRSGPSRTTSLVVDSMSRLDRPALVVWGERNRFIPPRHADDQLRSFPRGEIVLLPDEGHYAHLRAPQKVSERLLPFLRAQVAREAASRTVTVSCPRCARRSPAHRSERLDEGDLALTDEHQHAAALHPMHGADGIAVQVAPGPAARVRDAAHREAADLRLGQERVDRARAQLVRRLVPSPLGGREQPTSLTPAPSRPARVRRWVNVRTRSLAVAAPRPATVARTPRRRPLPRR